ncbi:MAG: hypothetical protein JWM11_2444 [Planctomycetaceae bacterium]|nr:hypothetical protein [Planctomycetaceae bacterium]
MLGELLKSARIAAGMAQEDLAFKAGVDRSYVSMFKRDLKSPTLQMRSEFAARRVFRQRKLSANSKASFRAIKHGDSNVNSVRASPHSRYEYIGACESCNRMNQDKNLMPLCKRFRHAAMTGPVAINKCDFP